MASAMLFSIPLEPRAVVQATEARLQRIYDAAKLGLKGDSLALAAGMLPMEYRRLCERDPVAGYAEQKGRADGEQALLKSLNDAAEAGDAKAAVDALKYIHKYTAPQQVQLSIEGKISVLDALKAADQRLTIDAEYDEVTLPNEPAKEPAKLTSAAA